jgi:hypothetical protein
MMTKTNFDVLRKNELATIARKVGVRHCMIFPRMSWEWRVLKWSLKFGRKRPKSAPLRAISGLITPHQYSLLDTVLWAARKPGSATLIASLKVLARLAGQGRSTVAKSIAALERLGLLQRIRRRIRVAWLGAGQASRQVANLYRLMPPDTESAARSAREQSSSISILETPIGVVRAAQEALEERRRQFHMSRCDIRSASVLRP